MMISLLLLLLLSLVVVGVICVVTLKSSSLSESRTIFRDLIEMCIILVLFILIGTYTLF